MHHRKEPIAIPGLSRQRACCAPWSRLLLRPIHEVYRWAKVHLYTNIEERWRDTLNSAWTNQSLDYSRSERYHAFMQINEVVPRSRSCFEIEICSPTIPDYRSLEAESFPLIRHKVALPAHGSSSRRRWGIYYGVCLEGKHAHYDQQKACNRAVDF